MTSSLATVLAVVAAGLLLVGAGFQAALVAGAPWAAAAYGGRAARPDGTLPAKYRVSSALTVVVLSAAGYLVLLRGGVVGTADPADGRLVAVLWRWQRCSFSTPSATSPAGIPRSGGAWAG